MIWPLGGRYFGTASAGLATVGYFEVQIPQGYHVPHCVGNPHWRIPNSSVRTNSSETRRSSSLSLKKLTKLKWDFQWFHSKDWVGVGFWDEHHLEITFLSITSTPFNSTVFPMTQERENETTKTKVFTLHSPHMNIQVFKVTPISSLSKSSGEPKSSAEDIHF